VACVPASAAHPAASHIPRLGRVLAATDLSDSGNQAVPYAYALAGPGGTVELCTVFERHLPHPIYAYDQPSQALRPEHRAELEAKLRALVPAEAEGRLITTNVTVIDGGTPAHAIVQTAERMGVDAIALGTHGRTGAVRAALGSVAAAVAETAPMPVLVRRRKVD
jgi:nucleotide-binding universal stress UspA family protein